MTGSALVLLLGVLGLIPAYVARRKGRDFFLWWVFGVLLLPLAVALSLIAPARAASEAALPPGRRACPACAEVIDERAPVCKYCKTRVDPASGGAPSNVPER